ncbi:MAG: PCP reductase family protein [Gemmatimonadota bacterium]
MKFLCVECDEQMVFEERELPGDGTFAAVFRCPRCERMTAMLANPMETQLVSSLGVVVGGRTVPSQPLELVRRSLAEGKEEAFADSMERDSPPAAPPACSGDAADGPVRWSFEAVERLEQVPRFVRGMVKRIYADYARQHGIGEITPSVMDRARSDLGLEGM